MNILKKIIATIIMLTLCGQMTIGTFAADYTQWELDYTKNSIMSKIDGGDAMITKIDALIANMTDEQTKTLETKLAAIKEKMTSVETSYSYELSKEEKILLILDYIQLKIELNKNLAKKEEVLGEFSQTLTDTENKKVNEELVKIQKNILTHGTVYLENIIGEFEKYANYQEKGDFKASINIDHEMVGEIKAELALSDYEVNSSNFDAQLKSKMSALIEAAPRGEEALKLEISGFIDFISKDQNYYLLLQELNIVDEGGIEEIEEFIQTMSDIAATNKYIHFEDDASQEAMEILKTFSPQSILAEGNEIVSQPLFKAYKKVGEKYYLIPTKYACDTAKELAEKFDPFNGSDCTQGQYDSMLEDLADTKMEFYIELGANTTIGFEADEIEDDIEEFNGSISFSSNYIEELNILIKPDQNQYPDEGGEISYKRNSYLNASFYNERSESDIKLLSTLDSNNRFTSIDADITSDGFVGNLDLANKKISGKYSLESWNDTWNGNISGKMDNTNQLSELDITSNISNTGEYSPFENTSRFEYNKGQMKVVNNFASEGYKSNFNISASWNPTKNEIVAGNLGLDVYTKDSSYDYDTYTTIYSGDFKKVFDTQMTLNNKAIEGKTTVISDGTVLLSVDHSGNYEKDYFKLHNNFTTELYSFLLGTDSKTTGNINIELDQRNNKNNGNLYIDINLNASQVLELEIDNKSKKEFKDINIVAPTNTVELEEVIELPQY